MIKLTTNESLALRIIRSWQERFRNSPTVHELADEMHIPAEEARSVVDGLLKKGFIDMQYPAVSQRLMIVPLWWE